VTVSAAKDANAAVSGNPNFSRIKKACPSPKGASISGRCNARTFEEIANAKSAQQALGFGGRSSFWKSGKVGEHQGPLKDS
jgi:hypothetical protein